VPTLTKRGLLLVLLAATAVAGSCAGGPDNSRETAATSTPTATAIPGGDPSTGSEVPASHPNGVVADCAGRSMADFGDAFGDPANLVAGPLLLVGAAIATPPSVVETHEGNKFPLLVREGHVVTVEVPPGARGVASLGYGPLPQGEIGHEDGHATVTFVACTAGEPSGSTANGPVTFWSGFLLARKPACVPLDVYVDDEAQPRRVEVELGRPC